MDEKKYGKIVAKNLRRIMFECDKTQADISRDLHINKATVSTWCNGKRIPRMDKVDALCEYLDCSRSDILEEHGPEWGEASRKAKRLYDLALRSEIRNIEIVYDLLKKLQNE